ncbi:MAG: hypothetical protein KDA96_16220, partial [Planctomycetaceae bacterium]|nr:hypothetical protein [Planctomycetaceae bacterium]
MSIAVGCKACGKEFLVGDEHAGKTIRCPQCRGAVTVGGSAPAPKPKAKPAVRKAARQPELVSGAASYGIQNHSRSKRTSAPGKSNSMMFLVIGGVAIGVCLMAVGAFVVWKLAFSSDGGAIVADSDNSIPDSGQGGIGAGTGVAPDLGLRTLQPAAPAQATPQAGAAVPQGMQPVFSPLPPAQAVPGASPSNQLVPVGSGEIVEGDRVAWLNSAGNGFARIGDSWVFRGGANEAQ